MKLQILAVTLLLCTLPVGSLSAQMPMGVEHPRVKVEPARAHHARVRHVDVEHIRLRIDPDLETGALSGTATLDVITLMPALREIHLDAKALTVSDVMIDENAAPFEMLADKLVIKLESPRPEGARISIKIFYTATPESGYLFIRRYRPDGSSEVMIHTQGEPEYHHHWFPCVDSPQEMQTSEILVRVPDGYRVLSNGTLRGGAEPDGLPALETNADGSATRTFQWTQSLPHTTYLITLIIGKFARATDSIGGLEIGYYAPIDAVADRASDLQFTFARTPAMIAHFTQLVGVPYPWHRYDQVVALGFEMGGMENTGQTTLHEGTLISPRDEPYASPDTLIAHELAHQWWGDLVTCADWSEIWLNEGFATYYEALWLEHAEGVDAAAWDLYGGAGWYFGQDSGGRRPIVWNGYASPDDVFDAYAYPKGGWVLHMLRHVVGDELFFDSLKQFLIEHRHQNVTTTDLKVTFEKVSERDLDWFFDQWLHHGGHPEYRVSQEFHAAEGMLLLTVAQVQKRDDLTPLFKMPIDVAIVGADESVTMHRLEINAERQNFLLPSAGAPLDVRFDVGARVLSQIEFEKPESQLIYQLAKDQDVMGRRRAGEALALKIGESEAARAALAAALASDSSPELRAHLADHIGAACGGLRWQSWQRNWSESPVAAPLDAAKREWARDQLIALASGAADTRARTGALYALANFAGDAAVESALASAASDTESDYRRAAAVRSLGRTKAHKQMELVESALVTPSHREVLARAALQALLDMEAPSVFQLAATRLQPSAAFELRQAALAVLSTLGDRNDPQVIALLIPHAEDPEHRIRDQIIEKLGAYGHLNPELALARLRPIAASPLPERAALAKTAIERIEKAIKGN